MNFQSLLTRRGDLQSAASTTSQDNRPYLHTMMPQQSHYCTKQLKLQAPIMRALRAWWWVGRRCTPPEARAELKYPTAVSQEVYAVYTHTIYLRWVFRTWQTRMVEEADVGGPKSTIYGSIYCSLCWNHVDNFVLISARLHEAAQSELNVRWWQRW